MPGVVIIQITMFVRVLGFKLLRQISERVNLFVMDYRRV